VPGRHDGAVQAGPDATVDGHQQAGFVEHRQQLGLRHLAGSPLHLGIVQQHEVGRQPNRGLPAAGVRRISAATSPGR
jgi:hypothetical protein